MRKLECVAIATLAALSACGESASHAQPGSFALPSLDAARPHTETTVRFYVTNNTSKSLQQGELSGNCIVTMVPLTVPVGYTIENVGIKPGCLTTAAFTVRLRFADAPAGDSVYFSTSFETANGIFSQAKVRSVAVPYAAVCTNVDVVSAGLYVRTKPASGCGGGGVIAKSPAASRTFDVRVENRTGIDLVGKSMWTYCMKTTLRGPLPAGSSLDAKVETKGGAGACDHVADLLTYYYEPHSKTLIEQIDWKFAGPNRTQLAVDGYEGFCAGSNRKGFVRFYKAGRNGCN